MADADDEDGYMTADVEIPDVSEVEFLALITGLSKIGIGAFESDDLEAAAAMGNLCGKVVGCNEGLAREALVGLPAEVLAGNTAEMLDDLDLELDASGAIVKAGSEEGGRDEDDAVSIDIE